MWSNLLDISPFSYEYTNVHAFWFLLILPILVVWYLVKESKSFHQIKLPTLSKFGKSSFSWVALFRHLNFFMMLCGIAFLILGLARPHSPEQIDEYTKRNFEGIDIVMSLDISESMRETDVKPNRLEAAKEVAIEFIKDRPSDRIGLVVYEGKAYTQAPLTNDHDLLIELFKQVETGMMVPGTAIGDGLMSAVSRLMESDAKSKVIILLTDGVNNVFETDPLTAAEVAKTYGICVYTIGVGKKSGNPDSFMDAFSQAMSTEVDEKLLTEIANLTGGKYFRAENRGQLEQIYEEIDRMEKSKVKSLEYKMSPPEKYYGLVFLGLFLLLTHKVISHTVLKSIP